MEKFILTRKGEFKPSKYTSNQCKGKGHKAYLYKISITCATKLDNQGFVIDHQEIDDNIQNMQLEGSCEEMSKFIKSRILFILTTIRQIDVYKIHIKIKPKVAKPVAYIQYIWE